MMTHPGEAGEGGSGKSRQAGSTTASSSPSAPTPIEQMTSDQLRAELTLLRDRERQIVELLNAKAPDRILHDLRNLLNEVQLLRILAEQGNV